MYISNHRIVTDCCCSSPHVTIAVHVIGQQHEAINQSSCVRLDKCDFDCIIDDYLCYLQPSWRFQNNASSTTLVVYKKSQVKMLQNLG